MRQMYGLGQWLQKEFGHLTDNKYVASKTMINSSYSDRCLESAQAFLAGFFKQNDDEAFVEGLPWRPIAVHYLPKSMDKVRYRQCGTLTPFRRLLFRATSQFYSRRTRAAAAKFKVKLFD